MPPIVRRTKVDVDPSDDEDETIRVYYAPALDVPPMPSVSVIKGLREDPEKENALQGWRDRYDGQSQWARPWWKDQQHFKAYRGTLTHFAILSELGDRAATHADSDDELLDAGGETYFHRVGDSDYGHEEYWAEYALKKWSKNAPSATSKEVPYTPRENKYDGEHAWDRAVRDIKWATRAFETAILSGKRHSSHFEWARADPHADGRLTPENVVAVEAFVYFDGQSSSDRRCNDSSETSRKDQAYGYGGQFDLLYEYEENGQTKTVLADVKTSSGIRFDHKLQAAAYKRAVETFEGLPDTVDECEILRVHPDSETVEVSRSPDWDRTLRGLEHQFLGLVDHAHTKVYADALTRAREKLMRETEGDSVDSSPNDGAQAELDSIRS